ncbi:MAG: hypothetical protein D6800_03395 [Candidatus Zixiibacteriota bacterium]|nr:MAG: hypothetical protein D6800_03395 [candidate division Zixibacteria bacterium]
MRFLRLILISAMVWLSTLAAEAVRAQCADCGNLDGPPGPDTYDFSLLRSFLLGDTVLTDSLCADIDGCAGLTIADLTAFLAYLYFITPTLNCAPVFQYAYPASQEDTVFLPAALSVAETTDRVDLAMRLRTPPGFDYWYLPLLGVGSGANDCFVLDTVQAPYLDLVFRNHGDTTLMIARNLSDETITLTYRRTKAGVGRIIPELASSHRGRTMGIGHACTEYCTQADVYIPVVVGGAGCCQGIRGNVNGDPGDVTDVADLTYLIDHLFISFPPLLCFDEADVNGDGVVDIADLTALIDALFVSFDLPSCPN